MLNQKEQSSAMEVPSVGLHQFDIHNELGSGSYCVVYSARCQQMLQTPQTASAPQLDRHARVAVKMIKGDVRKFRPALAEMVRGDLITERDILSQIDHPNIIKVHAASHSLTKSQPSAAAAAATKTSPSSQFRSSSSPSSPQAHEQTHGQHFLVLDRLECNLYEKLKCWRDVDHAVHDADLAPRTLCRQLFPWKKTRTAAHQLVHRVHHVGLGVAKAMQHLHANGILYRDLKPANIGFDDRGIVKLFDFGFAQRRLYERPQSTSSRGEVAGSPRYMAPEMFCGRASFEADVYSFGVLLYELCSLRKPFDDVGCFKSLQHKVVVEGHRPKLSRRSIPSKALRQLIASCWHQSPDKRPSFAMIVKALTEICSVLVDGQTVIPTSNAVASKSINTHRCACSSSTMRRCVKEQRRQKRLWAHHDNDDFHDSGLDDTRLAQDSMSSFIMSQ